MAIATTMPPGNQAHRLMECISGFMRSHYMLPLGVCFVACCKSKMKQPGPGGTGF